MLISIVTVNYNNVEGLKKTFASVQAQDSKFYEHIVIDGGSTDGSAAFLQSNESCFSYWVSEKDRGIYHAMNKGVEKCTGDYIYFLNSGDTFYSNSVISAFVNEHPIADLVYGDVNVLLLNGLNTVKKMPAHLTIGSTLTNTITHQAIFHKKALFDAQGYDETYKIIADWIFYNEVILIKKGSYKHIDVVVANFESGGLSSNVTAAELERERYLKTKFSPYFYDLLTEYNTLQIRYKNINSLFFVRWYTQFKNFIKKVVK
jgi:glycosyltransferase involved in cell wall biosynthesis